jgi:hypothetical protein
MRLKNYISTRKDCLLSLAIIFSLGLVPLLYFRDGLLIIGGDEGYQLLDPVFQLHNIIYVWDTFFGPGCYTLTSPLSFSYLILLGFPCILKIPLFVSEALVLTFLFMSAGLLMYFLIISVFDKKSTLAAVSSALFYMFNSYTLLLWSSPNFIFLSAYAMYPFMFALFLRGLKSGEHLKNGFYLGLGSLVFAAGNISFPFTVVMIFTLFLYFIFYLTFEAKNNKERVYALRFVFIAATIYLLVNSWWIPSLTLTYSKTLQALSVTDPRVWLEYFSSYSSMLHLLQLYGHPGWERYLWGKPRFSYMPTLVHNPFFIFLSFLPLILVGIAIVLLRSKVRNKTIIDEKIFFFFYFLYLLSIFLAKGAQPPFGEVVYYWLFEHIPVFVMFRSAFLRFGMAMALSLAVLFGIGLDVLYCYIKNVKVNALRKWRVERIIVVSLISLILIQNYPFFTGEVVHSGKGSFPSFHHRIPSYYYEAAEWINNQTGDFNIFSFYGQDGGWVTYNWGGGDVYIGTDIDPFLMHKPIVHVANNTFMSYTYNALIQNSTSHIGKLLSLLNVKYLLLHGDADPTFYGCIPPEILKRNLLIQRDITLEKSFGKLEFYRNEHWASMHIYATPNAILVPGNFNEMAKIIENDNFIPGESVLFLSKQLTAQQLSLIQGEGTYNHRVAPRVTYVKVNPTKYIVSVEATGPFYLVLSQSYHAYWRAYVDGVQVPEEYHFVANGYANAWYIDKSGSYDVVLEFWPQKLFYAGIFASLTTVVLCVLYLSKSQVKGFYFRYLKKRFQRMLPL